MRRITIIGGGVAGMGAAQRLIEAGYDVTLVEAQKSLGGGLGVDVPVPGGTCRVDTSMSQFNRAVCPRFDHLLNRLGIGRPAGPADVSFMTPEGATVWSTRRGSRARAGHGCRWLAEKKRFERESVEVLDNVFYENLSTQRYLDHRGYSQEFRQTYLYPRTAGCFSMPDWDPRKFPIRSLVGCWSAYGLVGATPERRRLAGGIQGYSDAFARWFSRAGGRLLVSHRAVGVDRSRHRIRIRTVERDATLSDFDTDEVVLATFPNLAVDLLEEPTAAERLLASDFDYHQIRVIAHRDPGLMPRDRADWGTLNYLVPSTPVPSTPATNGRHTPGGTGSGPFPVTYHLNRLARLSAELPDFFMTMNPGREPDPGRTLADHGRTHPTAGPSARLTAQLAERIQGRRHTWFCGAYLHEPFLHEQALQAGTDVATRILSGRSAVFADRRYSASIQAAA